ncbi:MAG: Rrf2 family transcriptional regulator [Endomicrobiales bacterium]|jgi:Rrf2 family protein
MKISFKGDYALKIILDLALTYNQGLTQIKEISRRQDIPEKFLEQIVTFLKSARYIKTTRGPKGGIGLTKHPSQITVGEIVRVVEGPTSPIACVSCSGYLRCGFEEKCVFKTMWAEVRNSVNDIVDKTTFQHMADRHRALILKEIPDYSI